MKQQTITYTNFVVIDGRKTPLEALDEEQKGKVGDQIRTKPLIALGYTLEKTTT